MKKRFWVSLTIGAGILASLSSAPAMAQDGGYQPPRLNRTYEQLTGDLNGDGRMERVALIPFSVDEKRDTYFMQLVVFDSAGKVLWKSPRIADANNNQVWGSFMFGSTNLVVLQDIDGDGRPELINTQPQSDVRPATYRVWKWDGSKFNFQFCAKAIETDLGSGVFAWQRKFDGYWKNCCWLTSLEHKNGRLVGDMLSYKEGASNPYAPGSAYLRVTPKGFEVEEWIKPIEN